MSFGRELQDFVAAFQAGNKMGMGWKELDLKRQDLAERRDHNLATDSRDLIRTQRLLKEKDGTPLFTNPAFKGSPDDATDGGSNGDEATRGRMAPNAVRALAMRHAKDLGYEGVVPRDGAKYGIKTGSLEEWGNFWTGLAKHESGLHNGTVGDVGQFDGGSRGQLQLSYADAQSYGLNGGKAFTPEQLADPDTNIRAGLSIGRALLDKYGSIEGGLGKYWGPISREGWTPGRGRDSDLPWQSWTAQQAADGQSTQAFADGGLVEDDEDAAGYEEPEGLEPGDAPDDAGDAPSAIPIPRPKPPVPQGAEIKAPTPQGGAPAAQGEDDGFGSLGNALDGGIRFLQDHFKLPKPGAVPDDPRRAGINEGYRRLLSGEGAATDEEAAAVRKAVDPNLSYNDSIANIAGLSRVWNYYVSKGDVEGARRAAAALMQHTRIKSIQLGNAALNAKTPEERARFVAKGYDQIPDGRHVEVEPGKNGTGTFRQIDTRTGKVVSEGQYTPEQLIAAANKLRDGTAYWQLVIQSAGEKLPKDTSDPGAEEYLRSVERGGNGGAIPQDAPQEAPQGVRAAPPPQMARPAAAGTTPAAPQGDSPAPVQALPVSPPTQASGDDPEPQPPQLSSIRTREGQQRAALAYRYAHDQWRARQDKRENAPSDDYIRAIPDDQGTEPRAPTSAELTKMTPAGRQQAIIAYQMRHKQWEDANAKTKDAVSDGYIGGLGKDPNVEPAEPSMADLAKMTPAGREQALRMYDQARKSWEKQHPAPEGHDLKDRGQAVKMVDEAFDDWNAARTQLDDGGKPVAGSETLNDQQRKVRTNIGSHVLLSNGSMSPGDALDAAHELLRVDPEMPDRKPWTHAELAKNGSLAVTLEDGRKVVLDQNGAAALHRERSIVVKKARDALTKKTEAEKKRAEWIAGGGTLGAIKRGAERFVGKGPTNAPASAIEAPSSDYAPNFD